MLEQQDMSFVEQTCPGSTNKRINKAGLAGLAGACSHVQAMSPLAVGILLVSSLRHCFVVGNELPNVTKSEFDSPVSDILWLGKDREIVMLYTEQGTLHRSKDKGNTFEATVLKSGTRALHVVRLLMSPASTFVVVAVGSGLELFASDDAGISWHQIRHPDAIRLSFMFHPTRPEWALLSAWTHDCKLNRPGSPCTHQLLVTQDLGRTDLKFVSKHVVQFSWGRNKLADRIFFTHFRDKSSKQQMLVKWMKGVDLVSTDDFGKSQQMLVENGNKFVISEQFILVARLQDEKDQSVKLMVSQDGSAFKHAIIPTPLAEKSYTILDASEGLVLLHVNHGEGLGNVYVSDPSGTRYVLSLQHNVGVNGRAAFEKVSNLKGIYFANVWALENATEAAALPSSFSHLGWLDRGNYQLGEDSTQSQSEQSIRYLKALGQQAHTVSVSERRLAERRLAAARNTSIHSVISFNVGGAWSPLKAPTHDALKRPVNCSACSLHLHDTTFQEHFVPFYSYDKAVGIIMAAGNIGPSLSYKAEESNTYLSRDGGLNWQEVRKGVHIYEFGNHGAVLVMAAVNEETNKVIYSLDEGLSWNSLHLDQEAFNVTNILIEPTAVSTDFLAFGKRGGKGIVYRIDFDVLGWMPCHSDSDYETWAPSDGVGHLGCTYGKKCGCLLGQQVRYVRRKQTSKCFNRKKNKLPVVSKPCACTQEDFECEIDFERALDGKTCVAQIMPPPRADFGILQEQECASTGKYHVDMYRRVAGDKCTLAALIDSGFEPS